MAKNKNRGGILITGGLPIEFVPNPQATEQVVVYPVPEGVLYTTITHFSVFNATLVTQMVVITILATEDGTPRRAKQYVLDPDESAQWVDTATGQITLSTGDSMIMFTTGADAVEYVMCGVEHV